MYLLTYTYRNNQNVGFLSKNKNHIIPVENIFKKLNISIPTDMNSIIEFSNDKLIKDIKNILQTYNEELFDMSDVKINAPIPYPKRNLFCLGKNYLDHINEVKHMTNVGVDIPKQPIYFSKTAFPAVGINDNILSHKNITESIDYEVELAIIIGKAGKNIDVNKAEEYIFGYTIANDVSARDLQMSHIQWHKGKCLDTFCPMGPFIVHKSELPLPLDLEIKCSINGEIRQSSKTSNMIFDIPYIISNLSKGITLYPGDIILTGTPSGVGMGFKPPKFLKAGDIIDCYIEKIGTLTNIVK